MATSMTICASFRKVELVKDTSMRPFRLRFEEEEVRGTPDSRISGIIISKSRNCPEGDRNSDSGS
jgi:hypothetical protein